MSIVQRWSIAITMSLRNSTRICEFRDLLLCKFGLVVRLIWRETCMADVVGEMTFRVMVVRLFLVRDDIVGCFPVLGDEADVHDAIS